MLTDVSLDTLINREETFGPIVPLIRVSSDEEALRVANDSHLGLQAAVYTSDLSRAFRYADGLQVGNVVVNDSTDYWEAHEPFGGASGTQTGWGRIGGPLHDARHDRPKDGRARRGRAGLVIVLTQGS